MPTPDPELAAIEAATQSVYQRRAAGWDRQRPRTGLETGWLDRCLDLARPGGHMLDLGCGAGDPLAGHVLSRGFRLTGLDYAPAMLALARQRYPQAHWREMDLRALALEGQYDGAFSWDGTFHLTPEAQRDLIAALARHLTPGAPLLLTVGPDAGETTGTVEGEPVYHASLSPADYRDTLERHGFDWLDFVAEDPACGHHSVLLARKAGA